MREAWQVGQRRLTDLSKVFGTVEVEARVLRLQGKAQTHGGRACNSSSKPDSKQCSRRKSGKVRLSSSCVIHP